MLILKLETITYERTTYSILDWLGDIGGLFDGLVLGAQVLLTPITAFALRRELLSEIFLKTPSGTRNII